MRSSRLLALLLHLQASGRATAEELAALVEVSVRTIYRDIAALQAAGIPLWTETGPQGGVRLLEGWQSHIAGLTADEAGLLVLAGVPGAAADLGLGPALAAAELKLTAGLAPAQRDRAAEVRARFLLDAPGWYEPAEAVPHLPAIARATFAGRQVELGYRAGLRGPNAEPGLRGPNAEPGLRGPNAEPGRAGRSFTRTVHPLGLVLKGGAWYLVAAHATAAGVTPRSYRVGRVAAVTALDAPVERPAGFALADWWRSSLAAFDDVILRVDVELRVSGRGLARLADVVPGGPTRRSVAAGEAAGPDRDGWYAVRLKVESEAVALDQLTGLGPDVEVVGPVSLRRALAAVGRAVADRNG
jgi:predicted DNA-binding transcriptional regulator YafY